ncbi:MAG: hypothetical protein GF346_02360 [Candidatus Eisenbacteria bacterium]|nr:hypothetical protein [Candidatus Latescibacterota bacterium]MBD3301271.1 hypothetical protein [Candidatus Eisenbacteria bacterium]
MNIQGPIPPRPPIDPPSASGGRRREPSPPDETGREAAANPSLWSRLTPEEREYFAQIAELGPLTYGPGRTDASTLGHPTGQRIDVRG